MEVQYLAVGQIGPVFVFGNFLGYGCDIQLHIFHIHYN
jgi:hypothetical protein